jgi:hypothetical protein
MAWTCKTAAARLGLPEKASLAEVKRAFRALARKTHPDMGGNPELFKEVLSAYEFIRDGGKPSSPGVSSSQTMDDEELNFGDWFVVRFLEFDHDAILGVHRCQLTTVEDEILLAVYLESPMRVRSCGRIIVGISERKDGPIEVYDREVLQSSKSETGELLVVWFSPFEERLRTDGTRADVPRPPPPETKPPPRPGEGYGWSRAWREGSSRRSKFSW